MSHRRTGLRIWNVLSTTGAALAGPVPPIHVPADYPELQPAIEAAGDGQRIIVSPGTYAGPVDFLGKNIFLQSLDPWSDQTVNQTVIDGTGSGSTVTISSSDTTLIGGVLFGLTITGGLAEVGGGVHVERAAPQIWRCVIKGNAVQSFGGFGAGVACVDQSRAELHYCLLSWNSAPEGGLGGALYFDSGSTARLHGCALIDNAATYGGAIYGLGDGSGTPDSTHIWFDACRIRRNVAEIDGGGIYIDDAAPLFTECRIDSNSANAGGGAFLLGITPARFERSTLTANTAAASFGGGAYLLFADTAQARFVDCVIDGNVAETQGGGIYALSSSPILVRSSISFNRLADDWDTKGGGLYCSISRPVIDGCALQFNEAIGNFGGSGGALFTLNANPVLNNCLVNGNFSRTAGAAITFHSTQPGQMLWDAPTVRHCTIRGNVTDNIHSGALTIIGAPSPFIENCILWGNGPAQIDTLGGQPELVYSCVYGGWEGEGNFDAWPHLIDFGEYRSVLHPLSPCVDAGTGDPDGIAWSEVDSIYATYNSSAPDLGAYGGPGGLLWHAVGDSGCTGSP